MNIYQFAKRQREAVRKLDAKAIAKLVAAYGATWDRISRDLERLLAKIERAPGPPTIAWLLAQERYQALLDQVAREVQRYAGVVDVTVMNGQRAAVEQALRHSAQLVAAGAANSTSAAVVASFNRVPIEALEHLVGYLADGSPLRTITLAKLPQRALYDVQTSLQAGLAAGDNPRTIGRAVRQAMGGTLSDATRISRTEVMRSYRGAAADNYAANSDVVQQMVRLEALDDRTCAICWAVHGTTEPLGAEYGTHPNCRGTWVPHVAGQENPVRNGEALFDKLDAGRQLEILGPKKFEAYERGDLRLSDLVRYHDDPNWGPQRSEKSLADALAG